MSNKSPSTKKNVPPSSSTPSPFPKESTKDPDRESLNDLLSFVESSLGNINSFVDEQKDNEEKSDKELISVNKGVETRANDNTKLLTRLNNQKEKLMEAFS